MKCSSAQRQAVFTCHRITPPDGSTQHSHRVHEHRGRSPGSGVIAGLAFPKSNKLQWQLSHARPLQLRGQLRHRTEFPNESRKKTKIHFKYEPTMFTSHKCDKHKI